VTLIDTGGYRLLIVEDSQTVAELLELIMRQHSRAYVMLRTDRFDSIISDVDWSLVDGIIADRFLGEYDGLQLLAWLEEHYPQIRRVMLTADSSLTLEASHAHELLHKSVRVEDLLAAFDEDTEGLGD
jgi:DNA-binding NarL/FixJ family response regulator